MTAQTIRKFVSSTRSVYAMLQRDFAGCHTASVIAPAALIDDITGDLQESNWEVSRPGFSRGRLMELEVYFPAYDSRTDVQLWAETKSWLKKIMFTE